MRYSRMQIKVGWWNLQLHGALVCLFLLWIHDTSRITLLMVLETQPCGWRGVSCNSSCIEPPVSPSRVVFTGLFAGAWKLTFCRGVFKAICTHLWPLLPEFARSPAAYCGSTELMSRHWSLSWPWQTRQLQDEEEEVEATREISAAARWKWFNEKCLVCIVCPLPGHQRTKHVTFPTFSMQMRRLFAR